MFGLHPKKKWTRADPINGHPKNMATWILGRKEMSLSEEGVPKFILIYLSTT
jgi:hypothetical protein